MYPSPLFIQKRGIRRQLGHITIFCEVRKIYSQVQKIALDRRYLESQNQTTLCKTAEARGNFPFFLAELVNALDNLSRVCWRETCPRYFVKPAMKRISHLHAHVQTVHKRPVLDFSSNISHRSGRTLVYGVCFHQQRGPCQCHSPLSFTLHPVCVHGFVPASRQGLTWTYNHTLCH